MKRETVRAMKDMAYYSSLGLQVALSIFIGLFFGRWLDSTFGTSPVLMMVFLGFGIAAGFRNILLALKKSKTM
ncbi:MAG: AtpZ/AtpI family protein [Proteobacteria bacterium]|nr:AtpZ/AtpI family protein [Pseudomonadota bacterium]